MNMNMF